MLNLNKQCPMDLVDKYTKIIEGGRAVTEKTEQVHTEAIVNEGTILCPRYGDTMVKRTATRDANEGSQFYDC